MRTALPLVFALVLLTHCKKEAVNPPAPVAVAKPVEAEPKPQAKPVVRADALTGGGESQIQLHVGGHAAPGLPFEIVKVYEKQQPADKAPFHADGGKWTYFDAKLADGTPFTVGVFEKLKLQMDPPMTLVDAALIVPTNDAGEKLALAYAKAFKVTAPPAGKVAGLTPLKIGSVNLGENVKRSPGGGFGGSGGGWTASKWTIERAEHAAEVYFNFSLVEKKGEWSQKDPEYDADVAKDLMEVLHDGLSK